MYHSILVLDFINLCQPLLINFDLKAKKQIWVSRYFDKHTYSLLYSQLSCWIFETLHLIHDYNSNVMFSDAIDL